MEENLNSWEGFLGSNFLNADDVESDSHIFVCVAVEIDAENGRPILVLESENMKRKFSLNVTNANFIKNSGIKSPRDVIGKKITFKKVMVTNPSSKKEVEGLRIKSVQ